MRQQVGKITLILAVLLAGAFLTTAATASFEGLGYLPTSDLVDSSAYGVSADGSVVVGYGDSIFAEEAFRWTQEGGMVGLGFLSGGDPRSWADGVSADGSVVVGGCQTRHIPHTAFRWTQDGGMVGLGDLPGGEFYSEASAVSADGSVVVGSSYSANGREAFRWTQDGGMVGLGDLPGGKYISFAFGVSADGSVVVGYGNTDSGTEAFRWTQDGGMVGLGDLPGGNVSVAYGVSADGSVVVGYGYTDSGREAFRWTQDGGMVGLGDLPGGEYDSAAFGVSADGSVVVGNSRTDSGTEAFIWNETNGLRNLKDVLETVYGLDLTDWTLLFARDISDDGLTIVGSGLNPDLHWEAWRAVLVAADLVVDSGEALNVPPSITFVNETIGDTGQGTLNQTGYTNTVTNDLTLGNTATGSGAYNLSGGSLPADKEVVGNAGAGIFTQSGGTNTITTGLHLGDKSTGHGIYELRGGNLSASEENVGNEGAGTFIQDGGTNRMYRLVLGTYNSGSGTYNLSNGSLSVGEKEIIGFLGTGTFIQTGGTNEVAQDLEITRGPGSTGLYKFLGGSLSAGTIQVNQGGTFMGAGTLSAAFTNRSILKPGTSVGTLDILGSYTQDPSATLEIEIASPTSFDQLKVRGKPGTATLNGRLHPVLLAGFRPQGNTVFRQVITATGGINGTFNTIGNGQLTPTLIWQGTYHLTSFDLLVKRDYTNPSLGLSPNQRAVGSMLNSVANTVTGDLNYVLNTIDYLPSAGAVRQAYQQISPEKAAPLPELGLVAAVLQQRSLARRITDLRFGSRDLTLARGFPGFLSLLGSRGAGGIMLAYNGADLTGMVPARQEAAPEKSWGVFLDPVVIVGSQGSSDEQTGYDYTLAGFTLGVDRRLGKDLLVGLATGYSHNHAVFRDTGGNITNNTWPITAYAAYLPEKGYAFASLGYSLNLFNLEREISFGSINRTAKGNTTGHQFNLYAEAGYDLKPKKIKPLVVTPAASLSFSTISVDGFTETNAGALNLKVDGQNADSLQIGVGGKVAAPFKKGSVKVVPQAYAFYQHEFSNNSRGLDARLSQGSSTLTLTTDEPQRNFAVVGGNVTVFVSKNLSAMVNYNAEVGRGNNTVHQVNAGLRWNF